MEEKICCCHKKKERTEKEYKDLIHRLSRIEGQVRGIREMVESDRVGSSAWWKKMRTARTFWFRWLRQMRH